MNETVSKMNKRTKELESKADRPEQNSRRYCILIHGIAENKEENKDKQAIYFMNYNIILKSTILTLTDFIGLNFMTRQRKKQGLI